MGTLSCWLLGFGADRILKVENEAIGAARETFREFSFAVRRNEEQRAHGTPLQRFPIRWNHLIEKELLRFKEVQHVLIEKVEQLFRNML